MPGHLDSGGKTLAADKDLKTSSQRWWLMVLLVTGMVICYAQRGALTVAAPTLIKELQISKTDMGFLLSAFFFLYSFMQMPAGWLVDRFGVKKAYALGFIVWSIAAAGTGLAGGFYTLIVFQLLLGVGQSVAFPASARAVANWFQNKERGIVTASYLTGVRVGQALAGAIGAYFLARYSWKLFFLVIGLVPILWFLPWYRFLSRWEELPSDQPEIGPIPGKKKSSFTESLALLKNRTVFGIFLGFFAYDYVWFVYSRWLAGYLKLGRGFSDKEMGVWTSVPFLVMSVVIVISGFLSDYLIRRGYSEITVRKTFIVVGLALCLLIVPAGMVGDRMASVYLMTMSLCGLGVASPNTWTLTQAVCPKTLVGTVSGIQNFGGNLGGIIAPLLTGYIADKTGSFEWAFIICGALLVVGMFAYIFLIERKDVTEST
jgi:ACS family D-galactonate transporter-like MFS transporter